MQNSNYTKFELCKILIFKILILRLQSKIHA